MLEVPWAALGSDVPVLIAQAAGRLVELQSELEFVFWLVSRQ